MENRDIHMRLLEILKSIDEICRKENLSYMLTQGTLLGAVREKGFIEWDVEDGDIMMYRKDFDSFLTYCREHADDLKYFTGYDENGLIPRLILKTNPEIFVEITLIDFLSGTKWKRDLKILALRLINAMLRTHNSYENHNLVHNIRTFLIWCFGRLFGQSANRSLYQKVSRLANEKKSSFVHFSNEYPAKMIFKLDRRLLEEAIRIPFEDTELTVPKEWDGVLRFYYGEDYMIPKRENYKTDLAGI